MQLLQLPANTDPVLLNKTPFLGGQGKEAIVHLETPAAGVMLQGHNGIDEPESGDTGWFTVLTTTATSAKQQEIELPRWIRRGAAGGADDIVLEGVL